MTVKHLQNIQNSKLMGKCTFPTAPDAQGSPGGVRRAQLQAFSLLAAWQKASFKPVEARVEVWAWLSPLDGEMELNTW